MAGSCPFNYESYYNGLMTDLGLMGVFLHTLRRDAFAFAYEWSTFAGSDENRSSLFSLSLTNGFYIP